MKLFLACIVRFFIACIVRFVIAYIVRCCIACIIIIMENCKAPNLQLKALNKHTHVTESIVYMLMMMMK